MRMIFSIVRVANHAHDILFNFYLVHDILSFARE